MKRTLILIVVFLCTFFYEMTAQAKFPWRELAIIADSDSSDWRYFWNNYDASKQRVKENIIRAKKLGCNMVRIPLTQMPRDTYGHDQGWPYPVGTGLVFDQPASQTYLSHIKDLIEFCHRHQMKVHLQLFGYAGTNNPSITDTININDYSALYGYSVFPDPKNGKSTYVTCREGVNAYLKDATNWIDAVLTYIDQNAGGLANIEVFELANEFQPTKMFREIRDSTYLQEDHVSDIILLEMTNYVRVRWQAQVNGKFMVSVWPSLPKDETDPVYYWRNLQAMLTRADNGKFIRPEWMDYGGYFYYGNVYFDLLSFHNYASYTFDLAFQNVLNLGEYQPSNHPYKWFLGEIGFWLQEIHSFEADQAKYYQAQFQIIDGFYETLGKTIHPLLGVGIWTTFDYNFNLESGNHTGITGPASDGTIQKRKAAYVVENNLEGLVDNPDFEIPNDPTLEVANDIYFDYSSWCNGWTTWNGSGNYNSDDYEYITESETNHYVQLNPAPNKLIGWSSLPGGMIRVMPGTSVALSADIKVSRAPTVGEKIFLELAWFDQDKNWVGSTPADPLSALSRVFKRTTVSYIVPGNAYYAVPYLMAWNANLTTCFDNVTYTPSYKPLISFTFDEDLQYYPSSDGTATGPNDLLGWRTETSGGTAYKQYGKLFLNTWAYVKSTSYTDSCKQVTALRMKPEYNYCVGALASSPSGGRILTYAFEDPQFPGGNVSGVTTTPLTDTQWKTYQTPDLYSGAKGASKNWMEIQLYTDAADGATQFKELTLFEHSSSGSGMSQSISQLAPTLNNCYPNPANPSTTIQYQLVANAHVTLYVFDVLGRRVASLVDEQQNSGIHQVRFEGSNLSTGVYFYQLKVGGIVQTKKFLLLK